MRNLLKVKLWQQPRNRTTMQLCYQCSKRQPHILPSMPRLPDVSTEVLPPLTAVTVKLMVKAQFWFCACCGPCAQRISGQHLSGHRDPNRTTLHFPLTIRSNNDLMDDFSVVRYLIFRPFDPSMTILKESCQATGVHGTCSLLDAICIVTSLGYCLSDNL
jgi:hypothetical protein